MKNRKKNLYYLLISSAVASCLLLSACNKTKGDAPKSDPKTKTPIVQVQKTIESVTIEPRYSYYKRLLRQQSKGELERTFIFIENHKFSNNLEASPHPDNTSDDSSNDEESPRNTSAGESAEADSNLANPRFDDVTINSIYESFLAKNIILNPELNHRIHDIFRKVFAGMRNQNIDSNSTNWFESAAHEWDRNTDNAKVLPVTQKQNLADKRDVLENGDNPTLALDFILFNARSMDNIGIGRDYTQIRETFHGILVPERGNRTDTYNGIARNQYGIVNFDIPALEIPGGAPWKHYGRDVCHVKPDSSVYNRTVSRLHIPLRCGISGSSTLAFWTLFKSRAELSPTEMRLFILSVWASLCGDGGHSLQEVLSAAKLNADYVKRHLELHPELERLFSRVTVDSIIKVTKNIAPLGAEDESGLFGIYYDTFFRKIKEKSFWKARKKAQKEFLEYLRSAQ